MNLKVKKLEKIRIIFKTAPLKEGLAFKKIQIDEIMKIKKLDNSLKVF